MNVRLLGDRILIKLDKPFFERNGLFYPEGAFGSEDEIHVWGTVQAVGPGRWATRKGRELGYRIPMEVGVGDRVKVTWFLSKTHTSEQLKAYLGPDTCIVKPEDVLCVEPVEDAGQPAN